MKLNNENLIQTISLTNVSEQFFFFRNGGAQRQMKMKGERVVFVFSYIQRKFWRYEQ